MYNINTNVDRERITGELQATRVLFLTPDGHYLDVGQGDKADRLIEL